MGAREWNALPEIVEQMSKLCIPANRITHHVCIQGATRTGKSVIMRQFAYQFAERRIPCIWIDPKREAVEEFYREGDWILNPGDARCPHWCFEEEAVDEMRGMAIGTSAFPSETGEQPFFKRNPRAIIARLAGVEHPTTEQLSQWLVDEDEIDRRLKGTDLSAFLSKTAGEMRSGMIAHLAELGRSLRFWPTAKEQSRSFSVRRWAREGKGSIFLSSTPNTIDAILPAQRMLLDMLIMAGIMTPNLCAFLLDEVASMGHIPKLETGLSLLAAAGNPVVLGFQEASQMRHCYGDLWRAIVSQAYTQIVLRTSEEESAKHAAGLLGKAEVERVRESRSAHWWSRHQHNYSTERVETYVVSPGEIQSLEDCRGYLCQPGRITPIYVDWRLLPRVKRAPAYIERIIPPQPRIETREPQKKYSGRYSQPEQQKLQMAPN